MLELNKIYLGECLEVMKDIDNKSIDMILCDLPYGTTKCKWDEIIPFEPLWNQYKRILKDNGVVVLFGVQPFTSTVVTSNLEWFKESLVWEKHKPSNFACGKYMHLKYHEDIIVFAKGKHTYIPQMIPRSEKGTERYTNAITKKRSTVRTDGNEVSFQTLYEPKDYKEYDANFKYPSTVIKIPAVVNSSKEKLNHPTQKSEKLYENLIKTYSNEGDLILDNCCGTGTIKIAKTINRNYIGIEKEQIYYDIACERKFEAN